MATKQLIFIHGGEAYSDYNAFLQSLRTRELRNVLSDKPKRWRETLRDTLGPAYEVYLPAMPNSENAKYEEWRIWFERHLALVTDGVILAGHSQGGWFLAKYLLENTLPVRVRALILVAAPAAADDFGGEDGGDFGFDTTKLPLLREKADQIYLIHSYDDPIVPFAHAEAYKEALPEATLVRFEDRGHFLMEEFPEFVEIVRHID